MPAWWPRPLTPRRRRAFAREVEEELRTHLAMRTEDNRRAGMAPDEAAADALARFGDVEHITAACLWAEQTHPLRDLQRLVVVGLLFAIGFGAFAVAFSLAWSVLVRPLRFDDADRLVRVGAGWDDARVPFEHFRTWQTQSTSFEHLTAFDASRYVLRTEEATEQLRVMQVTEDYFNVLGVAPLIGRPMLTDESGVVAISEGLWERLFQRSRSALGATLALGGHPHTVVGVMPEAAQLSHRVDLWHRLPPGTRTDEGRHYIVGRLRADVTLEEVRGEIAGLTIEGRAPMLYPLKRLYTDPVRSMAWVACGLALLALIAIVGIAFRHAFIRARCAAMYGSMDEWLSAHFGIAMVAAIAGLGIARVTQTLVYEGLLGRWGPMFDRALDGPVVFGVLGVALAVGAVIALGAQEGHRAVVRIRSEPH